MHTRMAQMGPPNPNVGESTRCTALNKHPMEEVLRPVVDKVGLNLRGLSFRNALIGVYADLIFGA